MAEEKKAETKNAEAENTCFAASIANTSAKSIIEQEQPMFAQP